MAVRSWTLVHFWQPFRQRQLAFCLGLALTTYQTNLTALSPLNYLSTYCTSHSKVFSHSGNSLHPFFSISSSLTRSHRSPGKDTTGSTAGLKMRYVHATYISLYSVSVPARPLRSILGISRSRPSPLIIVSTVQYLQCLQCS
jgi:hypothetical protein